MPRSARLEPFEARTVAFDLAESSNVALSLELRSVFLVASGLDDDQACLANHAFKRMNRTVALIDGRARIPFIPARHAFATFGVHETSRRQSLSGFTFPLVNRDAPLSLPEIASKLERR